MFKILEKQFKTITFKIHICLISRIIYSFFSESLANGYSSESTQWELSFEYQNERV